MNSQKNISDIKVGNIIEISDVKLNKHNQFETTTEAFEVLSICKKGDYITLFSSTKIVMHVSEMVKVLS